MPALQTLRIFSFCQVNHLAIIFFPPLRHCPNLKDLWIPKLSNETAVTFFNIILSCCPSIKVLRLHYLMFSNGPLMAQGYRTQDLLRMINSYRGLRDILMVIGIEDKLNIIPTLMLHSGWSLETIELRCFSLDHQITWDPSLRFSSRSNVCLRDLVEANWASNQIENLNFYVSENDYRTEGWVTFPGGNNEQVQETTAMLLFQLSMKFKAQEKYMGSALRWFEAEDMLLTYETASR
ncbi:hypothetical protein BGX33_007920 [Mortierella sp. NVP41]|nr:hypothetical protein BGX33_007920 [Mortierella sp. NVP41]